MVIDQSVTSRCVIDRLADCALVTSIHAFNAFHRARMIEWTCAEKTHDLNSVVTHSATRQKHGCRTKAKKEKKKTLKKKSHILCGSVFEALALICVIRILIFFSILSLVVYAF